MARKVQTLMVCTFLVIISGRGCHISTTTSTGSVYKLSVTTAGHSMIRLLLFNLSFKVVYEYFQSANLKQTPY